MRDPIFRTAKNPSLLSFGFSWSLFPGLLGRVEAIILRRAGLCRALPGPHQSHRPTSRRLADRRLGRIPALLIPDWRRYSDRRAGRTGRRRLTRVDGAAVLLLR